MSVKKVELEAINRRLQQAIRSLETENLVLHADNRHLSMRLSKCNLQLRVLSARYRRLADYVKRLRAWLVTGDR